MLIADALLYSGLIVCLLVENCWSTHDAGQNDVLEFDTRAGFFGGFFDDWALSVETEKLTPLLYKTWKNKCDAQLQGLTLTPIGNSLYYFYDQSATGTFADWNQARAYCTQRGMDLASLETSQEYAEFFAYVSKILGPNAAGNTEGYWIGLNDLATEGAYVWPTTGLTPNYPFGWLVGDGDPDSPAAEQCVMVQKSATLLTTGFSTEDCATFAKFVCEVQSPCREVLLLRYYVAKKLNIINDKQYQLQLLNLFQDKNFEDIIFNNNFNTITG